MAIPDKLRNAIEHFEYEVKFNFRMRPEFSECNGNRARTKSGAIDIAKFRRRELLLNVTALRALRKVAGL